MAIVLGTNTISGLAAGGLGAGVIARPNIGYAGNIVQTVSNITRTEATYSAPANLSDPNAGTEIALLTQSITPQKAGNKMILKFHLQYECHHDCSFVITRDGAIMANSTDGTNRWSGVATVRYDNNVDSTPTPLTILFVDNSTLSTNTTYRLHIRSSSTGAYTLFLNRTSNASASNNYEKGVSSVIFYEVST